jgi:hypothetical protein
LFTDVVHQPNSVRKEFKHFHKPPRIVTEENQKFWKGDAPFGASICKDCWNWYSHCPKNMDGQTWVWVLGFSGFGFGQTLGDEI